MQITKTYAVRKSSFLWQNTYEALHMQKWNPPSDMKWKTEQLLNKCFCGIYSFLFWVLQRAPCKYSRTPYINIDFIYFWFCDVKLHLRTNPRCSFRSIHARSCKQFILYRQRDIKFRQTLTFRETLRVIPSYGARSRADSVRHTL